MSKIHEFTTFEAWSMAVWDRGLEVKRRDGTGEDPYTHFSAYIPHTDRQLGYFGAANGSDANHGIVTDNEVSFSNWIGA